jgi:PAS domain S-box-containing protein
VSSQNLIEQNRLLSQEVKRRIDQMAAINTVASVVGHSLDLDKTLETALQVVLDVVGAEAGGISLIDEKAGELVLRAQHGWLHDFVTNPMRIPLGKGLSGQVIQNNDVIVRNDLSEGEEYAVPSFRREHFRSMAMAPMHARGKIIGILSIMSDQPNRFDDGIVSVLRVVADTVGVALANARLYESSVEQEHRLAAVIHSTADGILATDRDSHINLVNQTAETMLNIRREQLIGVPLREAPIPARIRDSLLRALSRETDADKAFQVTLEDESVISVLVSPIYVESQVEQDAQTDGWVIVLQEVTHLRQAEIARAQFIQAAAHDMRNPLSVTHSALVMLERSLPSQDPKLGQIIDLALTSVQRLERLIDDLLQLEHIESGYNFTLEEVNLLDALVEIQHEARPLMEEKNITFLKELPDALPGVRADLHWFKRAMHNYLGNAIKYTPEGGEIILRAGTLHDEVFIEVCDSGPGIPLKAHPHLFERFYRVEGLENVPGTGLGLAIVKSVAEAHNGEVYVRSAPGQGSIFGLKLPLHLVPE